MKTYKIKSEKDLDKYKDEYGYHIKGNAEFEYGAEFTGRLLVDGYLYIKAGWSIKAGGSIKAGEYIEAGESIEAGGSIKAGWYIEAGGSIKAGEYIEAGELYGISAGLHITCKTTLSFGLKAFAGICTWKKATDTDKTITCGKLIKGKVEYGILEETGIEVDESAEKAIKVLEVKGYKITKEKKNRAMCECVCHEGEYLMDCVASCDGCAITPEEYCENSERVDGKKHSWRFDGDDPYVICSFCKEIRDAISGKSINRF